MADYYPLIARAVASLEANTGENRRALYERARTALVAQLRGIAPALAESDITHERLALEDAIRKVEGEAARRPRTDLPRPPATPPRAEPPRRQQEDPRPGRTAPFPPQRPVHSGGEAGPATPPADAPHPQPQRPEPARPHSPSAPSAPPVRPETSRPGSPSFDPQRSPPRREESPLFDVLRRADVPRAEPPSRQEPPHDESRRSPRNPSPAAGPEPDRRGFPQAESSRAPRKGEDTWDQLQRIEPAAEAPLWEHPDYEPRPAEPARLPPKRGEALRNLAGGIDAEARRGLLRPRPAAEPRGPEIPPSHDFDRLEPQIIDENFNAPPGGSYPDAVEPVYDGPRFETRARAPRHGDEQPAVRRPRVVSYRRMLTIVAIAIAVAGFAGLAYWQRANIVGVYEAFRGHSSPAPREARQNGQPKIADRIGNETAPAASRPGADQSGQPAAPVAQRVVLYEEEPSNPQGKRYIGSAIWRVENISPGAGQPPQPAVRADVEIPERRITMTFSIRRNTDQTLPASHTIEITFNIPADFSGGGIGNVPGVLMKQAEQTRGVPLAGLAVKVTTGFFLIGLSAVEADVQRNVQLLKERAWFDIPLVYSNNQRAILAIEKGTPGDRAFGEAFAVWERSATSAK